MTYSLRSYQAAAVEVGLEILKGKSKKKSGILALPTGAGKSLVIASIAKELEGNTLVLQPGREILVQNAEKMRAFGETDIGVFSASLDSKEVGKVTFATIGSLVRRKDIWEHFDHIIIDECHGVSAKGGMYHDLLNWFGGRYIGLTATPYRMHAYMSLQTGQKYVVPKMLHRTRPRLFQDLVHITQVGELYEQGFLCPIDYHIKEGYKHSDIKLNSTGADFDTEALKRYNKETGLVYSIAKYIREGNARHMLVFCSFLEEAYELSEELKARGIRSATVSAKTPKKDRETLLQQFKDGEIKVVTNVGVLTTGFDFPALDCVILARPTQSVALYYQMVGRGIRTAEGKENVQVVDVAGNVNRFGRIETFTIGQHEKKHRLQSDRGWLTEVDMVSGEDMLKRTYHDTREVEGGNPDVIPFGKHKGVHLRKVPSHYLEWCVENFTSGRWQDKFRAELNRRKLAGYA